MTNTKQLQAHLSPLGNPDQLEHHTDERFRPETVADYRDGPERSAETCDHPIHHYNQTRQKWGDADTVATLLNRLDINWRVVESIVEDLGFEPLRVEEGVSRLLELHRGLYPEQMARMLPRYQFFSYGRTFNPDL